MPLSYRLLMFYNWWEPLKARQDCWRFSVEKAILWFFLPYVKSVVSPIMKISQAWCKEDIKLLKIPKAIIVLSSPWGFCGDNHIRGWKKNHEILCFCVQYVSTFCKNETQFPDLNSHLFTSHALFELVNVWPFIQKTFPKAKITFQELQWTFRMQRWVGQNLERESADNYNMIHAVEISPYILAAE